MRARLIQEKFKEDSDPIKDIGIGYKEEFWPHTVSVELKAEIIKTIRKIKMAAKKELGKKLIGKVLTGPFYTDYSYKFVKKSVLVKSVNFKLNDFGEIYDFYIISNRGTKYNISLSNWASENKYVITVK